MNFNFRNAFILVLLFVTAALSAAQIPNELNTGYPENSIFHGSEIENVQLENGNLHVDIPVWSAAGRGLNTSFHFMYNNHGYRLRTQCFTGGGFCQDSVGTDPLSPMVLKGYGPADYQFSHAVTSISCSSFFTHSLVSVFLREPDGTKHHFSPDPVTLDSNGGCGSGSLQRTLYANDGSGWTIQLDSIGNILYATSKTGLKVGNNTVDANGNQLALDPTTHQLLDTLGRPIATDGSYYDSTGTLQTPTVVPDSLGRPTQIILPNNHGSYSFTYAPAVTTQLCQFSSADQCFESSNGGGEIASITLPTGGQISFTFGNWDAGGRQVATRKVTANGVIGTWTYGSNTANPSLGLIVTDPAGKDMSHVGAPDAPGQDYSEITRYWDGPAGSSALIKTVQTDYDGHTASILGLQIIALPIRVTTTWNQQNLTRKVETDWDLKTVYTSGSTPEVFSWKNPVEVRQYDWGGGLLKRTHYSYRHLEADGSSYLNLNLADLPTLVQTYDGAGSLIAQSQNSYDGTAVASTASCGGTGAPGHDYCNYGASNNIRGNLTQSSRWLNTSNTWLSTTNTYDDLGNVLTTTDPGTHPTTFDYTDNWSGTACLPPSNTRAFPTTVTNALGHRAKTAYFPCTSLPQNKKDENDLRAGRPGTTFTYDLLNRPLTMETDDVGNLLLAKTAFSYNDTTSPLSITKTVTAAPDPDIVSTVFLDGIGRTKSTQLNDPEGNVTTEIFYDALGRKQSVTNPHRSVPADTNGTTQFVYDALSRVTDVIRPDNDATHPNTAHTDYAGNVTTVTDEALKQRRSRVDGLGRMVEVDEPGDPATTTSTNIASFQTAGNLVVYNVLGQALWASPWFGSVGPLYILSMQDNGNLAEYTPTWSTPVGGTAGSVTPAAVSCNSDSLPSGQTLASGGCLVSPNHRFVATIQSAGNLVVYDLSYSPWQVVWANSGTGTPGSYLDMQSDGNLVIYTPSSVPVWASNTATGNAAYLLKIQDQGNLVIYQDKWDTGTAQTPVSPGNWAPWNCTNVSQTSGLGKVIYGGTTLSGGQCLISSNGRFAVIMQGDGNLVIYDRSTTPLRSIWNSGTSLHPLDPGVALATLYTYDGLGNLTCVEQHGNVSGTGCSSAPSLDATSPWRVRRFTYDSLSRLLTAANPESGTISYQYNSDSVLTSKTDARGVTTNYDPAGHGIDALHRVTQKAYSGTGITDPAVNYIYDTVGNGVGRLANQSTTVTIGGSNFTISSSFGYDPLGRINTESNCVPSVTCTSTSNQITANYDAAGNLISLSYPDGRVVTTGFSAAGRMTTVNMGTFTYYSVPQTQAADSWGYFPTGAMNRGTYHSGLIETTGYNNRLQVSSIADGFGTGTPLFSKTYGYSDAAGHNNGNILSITDTISSTRNQAYTYDLLNRIASGSQSDNSFNITYAYDAWGNMKESGTSNFQQLFDVKNRITPSGSCSPNLIPFCYDAAGNLLMDNHNHVYTYDAESRIKTVDSTVAAYFYGADGSRARKTANGVSTEYIYFGGNVVAEKDVSSGAWTDYIFGYGGKRLAKDTSLNGSAAQYYHSDHLGTARLMTDNAGNKIQDCTFNPFGEQVLCSPDNIANHYRLTGKERDGETALDYFGARFYSSTLGRFITPDAMFADQIQINPQTWNLFAYVRNNPLRYIDPNGRGCVVDDHGNSHTDPNIPGESCEEVDRSNKNARPNAVVTPALTQDDRIALLAYYVSGQTSPHSLAEVASKGGQYALGARGGLRFLSSIRSFFVRRAAAAAVEIVPSLTGGVSRAALEAAANSGGETVSVVTSLTSAPQAGQALSVATGEGAEALANAAGDLHEGAQVFRADIPKTLIDVMERNGLAFRSITDMGGASAQEIRFAPQATEFVIKFFAQ